MANLSFCAAPGRMALLALLLAVAAALLLYAVGDAVWLSFTYRPLYLRNFNAADVKLGGAAALAYVAMAFGVVLLAVAGAPDAGVAALKGAVWGAGAYTVYNATNAATLPRWDPLTAVADVTWGTLLSAAVAAATRAALGPLA